MSDRNVTLSSLSEDEQDEIKKLTEAQYAPEEGAPAEGEGEAAAESAEETDKPVPWRERNSTQYPYLVRGAYLRCNFGSHARKLNLPLSHGDYIGTDPTMNSLDNIPGEGCFNIPPFGVCQSPSAPKGVADILLKTEKTDPLTGEPYKDADGNIIQMDDNVKGPPCLAIIVNQWQNPHPETLIGAANESKDPAITVGSFLVCKFCGVIEPISSGQPALDPPKATPAEETLPPDKQAEVEEIINNPNLSETEKADQIVGVYEAFLYEKGKSVFDDYDKARSEIERDFPGDTESILKLDDRFRGDFAALNIDIRTMCNLMGEDVLRATGQPGYGGTGLFMDLVGTGNPLDLKSRPFGAFTDTDYDWSIWSRPWEENMRQDYTGNYLFGYFGKGFFNNASYSEEFLLYGAGGAQLLGDISNLEINNIGDAVAKPIGEVGEWIGSMADGGYGDNRGDAQMIKDGIYIYNMTH